MKSENYWIIRIQNTVTVRLKFQVRFPKFYVSFDFFYSFSIFLFAHWQFTSVKSPKRTNQPHMQNCHPLVTRKCCFPTMIIKSIYSVYKWKKRLFIQDSRTKNVKRGFTDLFQSCNLVSPRIEKKIFLRCVLLTLL